MPGVTQVKNSMTFYILEDAALPMELTNRRAHLDVQMRQATYKAVQCKAGLGICKLTQPSTQKWLEHAKTKLFLTPIKLVTLD
jgi:hypothetical protein